MNGFVERILKICLLVAAVSLPQWGFCVPPCTTPVLQGGEPERMHFERFNPLTPIFEVRSEANTHGGFIFKGDMQRSSILPGRDGALLERRYIGMHVRYPEIAALDGLDITFLGTYFLHPDLEGLNAREDFYRVKHFPKRHVRFTAIDGSPDQVLKCFNMGQIPIRASKPLVSLLDYGLAFFIYPTEAIEAAQMRISFLELLKGNLRENELSHHAPYLDNLLEAEAAGLIEDARAFIGAHNFDAQSVLSPEGLERSEVPAVIRRTITNLIEGNPMTREFLAWVQTGSKFHPPAAMLLGRAEKLTIGRLQALALDSMASAYRSYLEQTPEMINRHSAALTAKALP